MKFYIIAGEASGDLHASNLMKGMKSIEHHCEFRAWGGDLMEAEGAKLVKHYRDLAFMGFAEVIMNLKTILGNIKQCKKDILEYQPDALILVDYPGFNMRIAEFAKKQGIPVYYYISPQVWAWKKNRVFKLKKTVDKMLVILPFEKAFYEKYGMEVEYVGHPLVDAIENKVLNESERSIFRSNIGIEKEKVIAILPGSRKQEINKMLPVMLKQTEHFSDYTFVLAVAPGLGKAYFETFVANYPLVKLHEGDTYSVLQIAEAAMVTSGTATLETALLKTPEVVCYKGNAISYRIAKRILDIKYISLVNLIMDEEVLKELIQKELNEDLLRIELGKLLNDKNYRGTMLDKFDQLIKKLGGGGASKKAAQLILSDFISR